MPEARINGITIHYRDAGEGFPVYLIHGYTGNLRNWALQIPALTQRFRAVSLDQRGHGLSEKPTPAEDYSLELLAEDAQGLLEDLGIEECYVVGHSMGGLVAQRLALERPRTVRALVLVDTTAEPLPGRFQARGPLLQAARERGMEAAFEEQLRINPPPRQMLERPEFLESWRQQFLMTSPDAYIHLAEAMAAFQPTLDDLASLDVPTLVVCGERDQPFVGPSRRMHERMAGSELVMIESAGHTPQIERPAEFNEALLGFLSGVHEGVAAGG